MRPEYTKLAVGDRVVIQDGPMQGTVTRKMKAPGQWRVEWDNGYSGVHSPLTLNKVDPREEKA